MKNLKTIIFLLALLFCVQAKAAFEMTVSRTNLSEGETFQVYLRQSSGSASVDFSPFFKDFDVVGQRKSHQSHFVNGKGTQTTETVLTLIPKRTGKITLPALRSGAQTTQPIEITVLTAEETLEALNVGQNNTEQGKTTSQGTSNAQLQAPKAFMRSSLSNSSPMEQTPVVYTLRVYTAKDVISGSITPPASKDFELHQIGKGVTGQENVNGVPYQTEEYKFSLVPLRAGKITVPSAVFSGAVAESDVFDKIMNDDFLDMNDFFMRPSRVSSFLTGRAISANSPALTIDALARPATAGTFFFPAQNVTLSEKYVPDTTNIKLGDAITRTVTIRALGASQTSVPDVVFANGNGYRQYPAKPEINVTFQGETPIVEQTQQIIFIPSQAGRIVLPSLEVPWYDSISKTTKTAVLPEKEIIVAAPSNVPESLPPSGSSNTESFSSTQTNSMLEKPLQYTENNKPEPSSLKLATDEFEKRQKLVQREEKTSALMFIAGLFIGAALILVVWFLSRYRFARRENEQIKQSRLLLRRLTEDLKKACIKNNPQKTRDALKALAAFYMPDKPNASLTEFAHRLGSESFINEIDALNNVLYGRAAESWNGETLFAAFNEHKGALHRDLNAENENIVPPLYPV